MSTLSYPYDKNRVNINVIFQKKTKSINQKMLVDTGFAEEGIVSEEIAEKFHLSTSGPKPTGFGLCIGHIFNIAISSIRQMPLIKLYTHFNTETRLKAIGFDGLVGVEFLKLLFYHGDSKAFYLKFD